MAEPGPKQQYTRAEVLRLLGLSERQLRSWEKQGLIRAAAEYDFSRLVALRTLVRLRAAKASTAKIRKAVLAVQQKLRDIKDPLTELKLYLDNGRIRVQVGTERLEAETGQLLLDFGEPELQRLVSFPKDAAAATPAAVRKRRREAENWFQIGVEAEQSGAPRRDVLNAYESALALDPEFSAALVNLGTLYFGDRDWEKAESYYRRALEVTPDYPLAHFNLGNLCDERGDRGQALAHYLHAIRLEPGFSDAHYNLALLYQAAGSVLKAVHHWKTYLKLDPNSPWSDIARRELRMLYQSTVLRGASRRSESPA